MKSGTRTDLKFWSKMRCIALKKTQMRVGTNVNLSFWCKSRCFECTKRHVRSGAHRDLCSGPKVAVLHAKTTDEGWDP